MLRQLIIKLKQKIAVDHDKRNFHFYNIRYNINLHEKLEIIKNKFIIE